MAGRYRILLFLILLSCLLIPELAAQSDNVAAIMSDFALPEYKEDNRLYFILYGKKAVNSGVFVELSDPVLDVIRDNVTDISGIKPLLGIRLYTLEEAQKTPPIVRNFWEKHPYSRYIVTAPAAIYDKATKTVRSSEKVHFRCGEMDVDGVGFDVDLERELIHIRNNVRINLRAGAFQRVQKTSGKESPEK